MKTFLIEKTETNRAAWNIAHKLHLANTYEIYCTYCRYHRQENARTSGHVDYRSWKRRRKTQYKCVEK